MKSTKAMTLVFIVIMLIVILASVTVVAAGVYTNGYESARGHYITANGAVIKKNGGVQLDEECDTVFGLKGAGFKYVDWGDYEIKIEANAASGLAFSVNGQPCKYAKIDFTEYFNLDRGSDAFTITEGEYGVNVLLGKMYDNVTITAMPKPGAMPYVMTVTSESGKAVAVYLDYIIEPTDIELNPSGGIVAG